jgi:hypothetical protein
MKAIVQACWLLTVAIGDGMFFGFFAFMYFNA